jgi:transcriptional regulator with XRE-family HTH domain
VSRSRSALANGEQPWAGRLGERLLDIRSGRGLSLAAVGEATGISTSFLSLLEKGRTDVSLGRLLPLLEYYGLSAADVLSLEEAKNDMVVRAGEAPFLVSLGKGIEMFLAAPDRRRPFLPLLAVWQPGARMSDWSAHAGDEFMYLLEGQLCIEFREADAVVLSPGDALFFSSTRAHRIATLGDTPARVLIVTTERIAAPAPVPPSLSPLHH